MTVLSSSAIEIAFGLFEKQNLFLNFKTFLEVLSTSKTRRDLSESAHAISLDSSEVNLRFLMYEYIGGAPRPGDEYLGCCPFNGIAFIAFQFFVLVFVFAGLSLLLLSNGVSRFLNFVEIIRPFSSKFPMIWRLIFEA